MTIKKGFPNELIGEEIEVLESQNKSNRGIKGKVVNETKLTLVVEQGGKRKTLLKRLITFRLVRSGVVIIGDMVAQRPEERIKGKRDT